MGELRGGITPGDRVRLSRAGPHRDRGDIGIVQEVGFRVVLVRFDRGDRNGNHLDLVDAADLESLHEEG